MIMSLLNFGFQRRKRKIDDADEECDDNHALKVLNIEDQQSVDVNMFAGKGQFLCIRTVLSKKRMVPCYVVIAWVRYQKCVTFDLK